MRKKTLDTRKEILGRLKSGKSPYKRGNSMTKNNRIAYNLGALQKQGLVKSKKITDKGPIKYGYAGNPTQYPKHKWNITAKGKKHKF